MSGPINTHGLTIKFGKHAGELWTRLPISYLKWLVNETDGEAAKIADAELARRGTTLEYEVELSGHAIDRASLRCRRTWHQTALNEEEGLYSWLHRISTEALEKYGQHEKIKYNGLKLVFTFGHVYPTLKSVMPGRPKQTDGPVSKNDA